MFLRMLCSTIDLWCQCECSVASDTYTGRKALCERIVSVFLT